MCISGSIWDGLLSPNRAQLSYRHGDSSSIGWCGGFDDTDTWQVAFISLPPIHPDTNFYLGSHLRAIATLQYTNPSPGQSRTLYFNSVCSTVYNLSWLNLSLLHAVVCFWY